MSQEKTEEFPFEWPWQRETRLREAQEARDKLEAEASAMAEVPTRPTEGLTVGSFRKMLDALGSNGPDVMDAAIREQLARQAHALLTSHMPPLGRVSAPPLDGLVDPTGFARQYVVSKPTPRRVVPGRTRDGDYVEVPVSEREYLSMTDDHILKDREVAGPLAVRRALLRCRTRLRMRGEDVASLGLLDVEEELDAMGTPWTNQARTLGEVVDQFIQNWNGTPPPVATPAPAPEVGIGLCGNPYPPARTMQCTLPRGHEGPCSAHTPHGKRRWPR
jgi:hypothetical protein